MFDFIIQGFGVALTPLNLGLAFSGALLGTLFGALPGIGPYTAGAIASIAFLSFIVWAHHMFSVGMPLAAELFFMYTTMLIAVPTGVKVFNWVATMWRGAMTFETPMLFAIGFIFTFIHGGLTGRARAEMLDAFQADPEFRVLFSTDAGGTGLNLQEAASIVVNLEVPWNPAVLEQRIGRDAEAVSRRARPLVLDGGGDHTRPHGVEVDVGHGREQGLFGTQRLGVEAGLPEMAAAVILGIGLSGDGLVQAFHEPAEAAQPIPIHASDGTYGVLFGLTQ